MVFRLTFVVGCAVAFCTVTAGTSQARTHDRKVVSAVMHQQEAGALLRVAGLRWISSGHCTRRTNRHCTSFDGLRSASLNGIVDLRQRSRCGLVISGGTERGHSRMRLSHSHGYKLDILPNRCINRYIRRHYRHVRKRGDGARQYIYASRTRFAREPSHWDITFV